MVWGPGLWPLDILCHKCRVRHKCTQYNFGQLPKASESENKEKRMIYMLKRYIECNLKGQMSLELNQSVLWVTVTLLSFSYLIY